MTKLEFIDKINDILIGLNTAESDALGSLYDELMRDAGWHLASELPVIPEGKFSVSVIAYCSTPSGIYAPVEIAYRRTGGWQYESVKWWCYPPEED
jgi:hypothetical protein